MKGFENDMSTPIHRALHYVELCYLQLRNNNGAKEVAQELYLMLLEGVPTKRASDLRKCLAQDCLNESQEIICGYHQHEIASA